MEEDSDLSNGGNTAYGARTQDKHGTELAGVLTDSLANYINILAVPQAGRSPAVKLNRRAAA